MNGALTSRERGRAPSRLSELETLKEIGALLTSTLELDAILRTIVHLTAQRLGTDVCSIYLFDADGETLMLRATVGLDERAVDNASLRMGEGITGWAAARGRAVAVKDVLNDPHYKYLPETREERFRSMLAVPLVVGDGRVGVVTVQTETPRQYQRRETDLLKTIAGQASGAIHNAQLYERLLRAHGELEAAQRSLVEKEKLAALGELSASIAHELGNPVLGLKGVAQLLDGDLAPDDPRREYCALILDEANRMERLMGSLRDFARPQPTSDASIDLKAVAERTVSLMHKTMDDNSITLSRRLAAVPAIDGDPDQLEQAMLNVVMNAIQAMPQGGALRISTGSLGDARRGDGEVFVEVHDSGKGMSPETLRRAFDPFFTTKAEGVGLGLVLTQRIIEAHGGTVAIETAPDEGTRVTLQLPVAGRWAVAS